MNHDALIDEIAGKFSHGTLHCHHCGNRGTVNVRQAFIDALTEFAARQSAEAQGPVAWMLVDKNGLVQRHEDGSLWVSIDPKTGYQSDYDRGCIDVPLFERPHPAPLPDTVSVPDAWMPIETAPHK